jgi:hypothetical protein
MLAYDLFNNILDNLHPGEIIRLLFVLKNKYLIDTIDWNYLNKKYKYDEGEKEGFDKFVNGRKKDIEAVKKNVRSLRFIKEHDTEICMYAVKQDGLALCFIKKQDTEIYMEAIKHHGWSVLRFIYEKNKEMCMNAVKQDGNILKYVIEQDKEICMEAVKQQGLSLQYVIEQDAEICMVAIKQNRAALLYVKKTYKKECENYILKLLYKC